MTTVIKTVTATEAKNRFGAMLRKTYADAEHVIIERDGIPVAALIPIQDYEHLHESNVPTDAIEAASARQRIKAFLKATHAQMPEVAEDETKADISAAVKATCK